MIPARLCLMLAFIAALAGARPTFAAEKIAGSAERVVGSITTTGALKSNRTAASKITRPIVSHDRPTIHQAILKAMELSKGLGLYDKSVVIAGWRQKDGSVQVRFSRPQYDATEFDIQSNKNTLLDIAFKRGGITMNPHSVNELRKTRPRASNDLFAKAAMAAFSVEDSFENRDRQVHLEIRVRKQKTGFFVFFQSVRPVAGAHTGFMLSDSFRVTRIFLGR